MLYRWTHSQMAYRYMQQLHALGPRPWQNQDEHNRCQTCSIAPPFQGQNRREALE